MQERAKKYFTGVGWFILSLLTSTMNDTISKYFALKIPVVELTFFRMLFGVVSLLPIIALRGVSSLKTSRPGLHVLRGFLLFIAMTLWTYGLTLSSVVTATIVSFTIPLFVLIFALFLLKEKIIWQRWLATIFGFAGLGITFVSEDSGFLSSAIFVFAAAAMCFAMLDVINKKFVIKETMISMLFYSAFATTVFLSPFTIMVWQTPALIDLLFLFILGAGGNLLLYFILRAFACVDVTALAPYRYLEYLFTGTAGYIIFYEIPTHNNMIGGIFIVISTLFIVFSEHLFGSAKKK